MISSIYFPRSGKLSNIKLNAKQKLSFSNNVVELNVVSSLAEAGIDRQNLTHIKLGENVSALLPSCFADCTSLTAV